MRLWVEPIGRTKQGVLLSRSDRRVRTPLRSEDGTEHAERLASNSLPFDEAAPGIDDQRVQFRSNADMRVTAVVQTRDWSCERVRVRSSAVDVSLG
jgi:hypothetical protein